TPSGVTRRLVESGAFPVRESISIEKTAALKPKPRRYCEHSHKHLVSNLTGHGVGASDLSGLSGCEAADRVNGICYYFFYP
ncbi:MAG: hypothetical protein LBL24_01410, partial [Bacteroidales bacterium]|nr:hypothetical protein [Bacteroidales bacterium]